jgi:catecholate siderophore receptor
MKPKKRRFSTPAGGMATRPFLATGALVAYAMFGIRSTALAAPPVTEGNGDSAAEVQLPVRRFDIASGPLDTAIAAWQQISSARVETTLSPELLHALYSPGVRGLFPSDEALRRLLEGSGVSVRFRGSRTVTLQLESVSEQIEVTAPTNTTGVTLPRYTEPLRETPQSISVVPKEVMEQQNVTTLRDTLRNVAGISIAAGEGGAQGDNLTLRGFTARNDIFLDGMRDFGSYYRDPFNLESVEVLKGPSSAMFGRGSTGGVVNQATKQPMADSFVGSSLSFGSDSTRRATADINEPLPSIGAELRINVMGHQSGVAERDVAENHRFGFAPVLSFGANTTTRVTLGYFHLDENDTPDYGVPWLFNRPAPVDRSNYYGFEQANFLETTADVATLSAEHDFGGVTLRNQFRTAHYDRDVQITEGRMPAGITPATPLDSITVTRGQIAADSVETMLQDQLDLTTNVTTGPVHHVVTAGLDVSRETSDPTRQTFTGVPGTNLLHPDPSQPFSGAATVSSRVTTTAKSVGGYIADTMKLGAHWDVVAALRWDRLDADFHQFVAPVTAFRRVDNMTSVRGGIVYKPTDAGSIYAQYGTSFNPSAESLSLSAATADIEPEKNETIELGTKWDIDGGRLSLRTALFRTDKTNAREPDPVNPLLNVLAGEQRVQGIEIEASGRITRNWSILSSYAHMKSELTDSRFYTAFIGLPLGNVPKDTASLWTSYFFANRLQIGGGGQYVSSRIASTTAPFDTTTGLLKQAPGYVVLNANVEYPITPTIELQVNLYNLANKLYYDQLHPGHIVPGAGRSAVITANYRFRRPKGN